MFDRMIAASQGLRLFLNTDFAVVRGEIRWNHLVYCGPIDEYYDCRFGPLPYRSLRFDTEHYTAEQLKVGGSEWGAEVSINPSSK